MIPASRRFLRKLTACLILLAGLGLHGAFARDAAFADPGAATVGSKAITPADAVVVEPKGDIDTGDSIVNVARRTTLFFTNKTNAPVEVVGVTTNDDLNVKSSIVSNDCTREGKIAPASRCMVVVETIPTSPSSWTSEVLLTHNGFGRIARAKLTGKPATQTASDKKDSGFTLSTKDIKPIDFGEVDANEAKVVRTALMINDSNENITLVSIDVIAADNGFERLNQGCVVDMELKPGESCPVTLMWKPETKGIISTDLIIRHTGKLGFAVIPIRGVAKDSTETAEKKSSDKDTKSASKGDEHLGTGHTKQSTADELEKSLGGIPLLTQSSLPQLNSSLATSDTQATASQAKLTGEFRLIGTVGNRAILLTPDGTTAVVSIGEEITTADGRVAKLTNLTAKSAEIFIDGKKKELIIGAARELTSKISDTKKEPSSKNSGTGKNERNTSTR